MSPKERRSHHYGAPLTVRANGGRLVIQIGVDVLAHALKFAEWSVHFDEGRNDYAQRYRVVDATEFAKDVMHAMLDEREDGSTPLSAFLDAMSQAAVEDGSLGVEEDPNPTNPYARDGEGSQP